METFIMSKPFSEPEEVSGMSEANSCIDPTTNSVENAGRRNSIVFKVYCSHFDNLVKRRCVFELLVAIREALGRVRIQSVKRVYIAKTIMKKPPEVKIPEVIANLTDSMFCDHIVRIINSTALKKQNKNNKM